MDTTMDPIHAQARSVLMITQYVGIGGLERMLLNLCTELSMRAGIRCHVLAYDHDPVKTKTSFTADFQSRGIPIETFKKKDGFSIEVVRRVRRLVDEHRIDIVHSHNLGSLIYASAVKLSRLGRLKLIHTQHSFIHLQERKVYAWYERLFSRFADTLTAVSEDTRHTYEKLGIERTPIHLIENGIPWDTGFRGRHSDGLAERRLALIESLKGQGGATELARFLNDRWVLCLARLHPEKGQREALGIWRELSAGARRRAVLLLLGPESLPEQARELEDLRRNLPDAERVIIIKTATKEPELWFRASDVYLSCSKFEGMPLGVLEAAVASLPLLLSDIPGHQFVRDQSLLYPLHHPGGGAKMLEDLLRSLDSQGDQYFETLHERYQPLRQRFSLTHMAEQYRRLYEALAPSQALRMTAAASSAG